MFDFPQELYRRVFSGVPTALIAQLHDNLFPGSFPFKDWSHQSQAYARAWDWYLGKPLQEAEGKTPGGQIIYKYPLQLNPLRTLARKHVGFLFGEIEDENQLVVEPRIVPHAVFAEEGFQERLRKGKTLSGVVQTVLSQSNANALFQEAGTIAQFLGGVVFQLAYTPLDQNMLIPLRIKSIIPDYFMPVWASDTYELLEAFVVYWLSSAVAERLFGESPDYGDLNVYVEHWTPQEYSIYLNAKPLRQRIGGETFVYDRLPNPFGFVPFVYIPHLREGGFYGISHLPDVQMLVLEFNSRLGDLGDVLHQNANRLRYIRNVFANDFSNASRQVELAPGVRAIDLGVEPPTAKHPPDVILEDAAAVPPALENLPERLFNQLMYDGLLSPIAFGIDEGSQRSALTLALRMWPSTSHARAERIFWTAGLKQLSHQILLACQRLPLVRRRLQQIISLSYTEDELAEYQAQPQWRPILPRDHEVQVNEIILRVQAGILSPETAIRMLGDVDDVDEELRRITEWGKRQAELQAQVKMQSGAAGPQDQGAPTDTQKPVASLREE